MRTQRYSTIFSSGFLAFPELYHIVSREKSLDASISPHLAGRKNNAKFTPKQSILFDK